MPIHYKRPASDARPDIPRTPSHHSITSFVLRPQPNPTHHSPASANNPLYQQLGVITPTRGLANIPILTTRYFTATFSPAFSILVSHSLNYNFSHSTESFSSSPSFLSIHFSYRFCTSTIGTCFPCLKLKCNFTLVSKFSHISSLRRFSAISTMSIDREDYHHTRCSI